MRQAGGLRMATDAQPAKGPDPDPTQALLGRARAGDKEAFAQLLEVHGKRLRRSARARLPPSLRGRIDASDVVQDALLDAVQHFDQFEDRGRHSFRGWLSQLLRNRLLMTVQHFLGRRKRDVRRETRRADQSGSHGSGLALVSPQSSPSVRAMRHEQHDLLDRALATLPKDYAEVLRLVRIEEQGIAQAAAAMGRSENAVKKLLARALIALEEALSGADGSA